MKSRSSFVCASFALLSSGLVVGACSSSSSPAAGGGMVDASPEDAAHASDAAGADAGTHPSPDAGAEAAIDADAVDSSPIAEAAAPTCGAPPNRFTLLTGTDAGLVRDNVTELVWMSDSVGGSQSSQQTQALAATYCAGRGMRLPTEDEALAIAAAYSPCAFGQWGTWTSTAAGTGGDAWVVDYLGDASPQLADNFPSAVLCVRGPAG